MTRLTTQTMKETMDERDGVGPVLQVGDLAVAVVDAIRRNNPGVVLRDRGSYIRVLAPKRCVLSAASVEQCLGRPFRLPQDLELIMPAFKGRLHMNAHEAVWSFES